jgi:hypothetical protein
MNCDEGANGVKTRNALIGNQKQNDAKNPECLRVVNNGSVLHEEDQERKCVINIYVVIANA